MSDTESAAVTSDGGPDPVAAGCLDALRARGETVATAESLTAGLVCATLARVPGASDCLRGGLAAYATDVKSSVLGIDAAVIERYGVVSAECAAAMARSASLLFDADWACATTGVAGPTEQDGQPVGRVFVAVAGPSGAAAVRALMLGGDRDRIRRDAVDASLTLLVAMIRDDGASDDWPQRREVPIDQG